MELLTRPATRLLHWMERQAINETGLDILVIGLATLVFTFGGAALIAALA